MHLRTVLCMALVLLGGPDRDCAVAGMRRVLRSSVLQPRLCFRWVPLPHSAVPLCDGLVPLLVLSFRYGAVLPWGSVAEYSCVPLRSVTVCGRAVFECLSEK